VSGAVEPMASQKVDQKADNIVQIVIKNWRFAQVCALGALREEKF
jgi:hypothetical protein